MTPQARTRRRLSERLPGDGAAVRDTRIEQEFAAAADARFDVVLRPYAIGLMAAGSVHIDQALADLGMVPRRRCARNDGRYGHHRGGETKTDDCFLDTHDRLFFSLCCRLLRRKKCLIELLFRSCWNVFRLPRDYLPCVRSV